MKIIRQAMTALSLGAGLVALASAAHSATADDTGLEEIIVRAQRVEQSLQDVPVAVTPVSGAELETRRLHDFTQLTVAIPSLEVTEDNAFALRGIGSQIYSANVDSSVGVMADEVSLGVPLFMSNAAFIDVDQVEALTGPQGLLFGRNASAGLLNIITKKPQIGKFGGEGSLEYDDRDAPGGHFGAVATGILNLPVSTNSALRLNVLYSDQDPLSDVIVNKSPRYDGNQKRLLGKAKWLWDSGAGFSAYLIGDYSHESGVGGIWDDTFRATGLPAPPGQDVLSAAADGVTPSTTNFYKGLSGPQFRSVDTGGVVLNLSARLSDEVTLSNILAWRRYYTSYNLDVDNSSLVLVDKNGGAQSYNQYSEELRLAYKGSRVDGQAGIYLFSSTNDAWAAFRGDGPFPPGTDFVRADNAYHLDSRSVAGYGQFNFHVTDSLRLIAGARATNDNVGVGAVANQFDLVTLNPPLFGFIGQLPFVLPFGPVRQSYTHSDGHTNLSYKVGAQFNVAPDVMFYGTWGTGYKGPAEKTYHAYTGEDPYLKPETVDNLEVGMKSELFEKHLRLNIAGFYEKFKDFQVQAFDVNGFSTLTNAEGVRSTGVEFSAAYKVSSALTLSYNATLQDSHFTDFSHDPCYTQQSAATCTNGRYFQGAGIQTPASARFHGTFDALYSLPLGAGKLDFDANWYHRSSINFSTAAAPYQALGAIDVFGASVAYRLDNGFSASIFDKNCSNEIYPSFVFGDPLDGSGGIVSTFNRWGYNSVRTIGASVGYKF